MSDAHKKYRSIAHKLYRFLIVVCTLALIAAVLYVYFVEDQM